MSDINTNSTLWTNSADDKQMIFFLGFDTSGENLHEVSNPIFLFSRKNKKTISKCHLLKFLPSRQSAKCYIVFVM